MSYSVVWDKALKLRRRSENPTIDGESIIQELGFVELKTGRFYWVTTDELQAEIILLETEAIDGWVIVGDVSRNPISEPLDLYNAQVVMRRYVAN